MKNKGFTLVELLVVISIVGLLSSVVFASVNVSRKKAADSSIKATLSGLRNQALLVYDNVGCYAYSNSCSMGGYTSAGRCSDAFGAGDSIFDNALIKPAITSAYNTSGGTSRANCVQAANGGAWAIAVALKTVTTNSWCVDSTGASRQVTPVNTDLGFNGNECK
jgi:prepilin-type N-terminal cleavage/methylation domain-containing protein